MYEYTYFFFVQMWLVSVTGSQTQISELLLNIKMVTESKSIKYKVLMFHYFIKVTRNVKGHTW